MTPHTAQYVIENWTYFISYPYDLEFQFSNWATIVRKMYRSRWIRRFTRLHILMQILNFQILCFVFCAPGISINRAPSPAGSNLAQCVRHDMKCKDSVYCVYRNVRVVRLTNVVYKRIRQEGKEFCSAMLKKWEVVISVLSFVWFFSLAPGNL